MRVEPEATSGLKPSVRIVELTGAQKALRHSKSRISHFSQRTRENGAPGATPPKKSSVKKLFLLVGGFFFGRFFRGFEEGAQFLEIFGKHPGEMDTVADLRIAGGDSGEGQ